MITTEQIIQSSGTPVVDLEDLATTIDALMALERDASACAVAMVAGDEHCTMGVATRAALDCADTASTAHRVLSRVAAADVTVMRAVVEAAAVAADRCAKECGGSSHAHCQIHVESSRRAAGACWALLKRLPAV
ncbi:MAG: hypothetical protein QOC94_2417 [Actinoplanes sp.]|jgi:hypothetical protein|nr:hypothetical protein [Pseudonocardiales bacterium]MDT5032246.1 hypothetical protein [Actinoplanes sp.]